MRSEHLHQWLIFATQDNTPDATKCKKVIAIVKAEFRGGTLVKEFM